VRPAYEGADERKTRLTPNINLFYGDTYFLTGMTAGANLWKHTTAQGLSISAGPLLALRRGRDEDDAPLGWATSTTASMPAVLSASARTAGRRGPMSARMSRTAMAARR
jgi:outer membrane scaffolding protein for murein synthesis (MipA/OmpV family)